MSKSQERLSTMETKYKGCIYQYKKYVDYDGKPDKENSIILVKAQPIDPTINVIYAPAFLDGRKIRQYEYGILPYKKEFEIIVDEGIDYFHLNWYGCKLIGLELPKSLRTFYTGVSDDQRLFLKKISVKEGNPVFDSRNNSNCLIETKTNKLILIGIESEIPEGVNEIGENVFNHRRDLSHLNIPSSVTTIGQAAFRDCWLPSDFSLPTSIKKICNSAFLGAKGLKELYLPNVEVIEGSAFAITELSKIVFGNNLKSIGDSVFRLCNELKEIELPDSITSISPNAFSSSNIKIIHCSEKVANLIAKTKASKKIKLVIENKESTTVENMLNRPDNVFDLDACLKNRKDYCARNINIDMVVEFTLSFEGGMSQDDGYNYYDYKDTVIGTLQHMPNIDASSFDEDVLTHDDGRETVLHTLQETFEWYGGEGIYNDYITLASTNVFNYLKYEYDPNKDVYYIIGVKKIHSIGYLALGFGKEKIIIKTNAFSKRNVVNLYIGPNVVAIMEGAFPSLTNTTISISEGVDYIGPNAFTMSKGYIRYGGASIPKTWSNKWNNHNRTFYIVNFNYTPLKLSDTDIECKIKNYKKYINVRWDNDYKKDDYDSLFQESLDDREKLIKMINLDDSYIQKIPDSFKNDPHVFLAAIVIRASNFQYAGDELKKNKDFILEFLRKVPSRDDSIIPYIDEDLFNDFAFMKQLIEIKPSAVKHLGPNLKENRELWIVAIENDDYVLEDLPKPLTEDVELCQRAINKNGINIRYFSPAIRKNRELAIEAIKKNGSALGYVDPSLGLSDDIDIVMMAISTNCYSIKYASERLQKNEDVALFAVKTNCSSIDVLHKSLLSNKKFILKAMMMLDKSDRDFAYDVFVDCMDESLQSDKAFMKELERLKS